MRKIIQIASTSEGVLALCDDGTVWEISSVTGWDWKQLPSVPQEKKPDWVPGPVCT